MVRITKKCVQKIFLSMFLEIKGGKELAVFVKTHHAKVCRLTSIAMTI